VKESGKQNITPEMLVGRNAITLITNINAFSVDKQPHRPVMYSCVIKYCTEEKNILVLGKFPDPNVTINQQLPWDRHQDEGDTEDVVNQAEKVDPDCSHCGQDPKGQIPLPADWWESLCRLVHQVLEHGVLNFASAMPLLATDPSQYEQ
jgi:hypothetical protein